MSSQKRKGRQTRPNTNDDDGVKKEKEAFSSLDCSSDPERIRQAWQKLRQAYEDTVNNNSNSDTHRPFPIWARSQFEPKSLEDLLSVGYTLDIVRVSYVDPQIPPEKRSPSISQHFKVDPWQFILHFDYVGPEKAQVIKKIATKRANLTFTQLYEEVQKNRLHRIKHQKNPKYEFLPSDFEACLEENDNEDGNNAKHYHEREQNQAEEGNRNGNPENGHPTAVNNTRPNSYESAYIVVSDEQEDDLEPLSDILDNATPHSSHPRVSSLPIMTRDKTDGDSEVATPISPMPHPANMSIRRGLSREQSSSLDPLSDEGIFSSIEQQLLQDRRSEFLIYKSLQASMKTTNESSEKCLKWLKERQVAYAENLKQVALNASPSHEEEIQPALDGIADKLKKNLKKRKFLEDDKEERATKLGNPGYQEYYKKASL